MSDRDDKDKLSDIIGFKEFLEPKGSNKGPQESRQRVDGFELLTFLEQDSTRIEKLKNLFEEKAYLISNYPQDPVLNINLNSNNLMTKSDVTEELRSNTSPLVRNLAEMFNRHFNGLSDEK